MITLVVPTRNRAHTLKLVTPSYYAQEGVTEIVFVSDEGSDDTPDVVESIARTNTSIATRFIRNESRLGAAASRNVGVTNATNEYILFSDDDEYLEPLYAITCLRKLEKYGAGAVSGRNVYMLDGETPAEAVRRFGSGLRRAKPFRHLLCEPANGAVYDGDISLPFTHSIILTKRSLLLEEPFDPHYLAGNGYREESDYQMRLFLKGLPVYVTNDVHCIHLAPSLVRSGGQRTSLWRRIYWSIRHTAYFHNKYYKRYACKVGLKTPRSVALFAFAAYCVYRETLRPWLHRAALAYLRQMRQARNPAISAVGEPLA